MDRCTRRTYFAEVGLALVTIVLLAMRGEMKSLSAFMRKIRKMLMILEHCGALRMLSRRAE